MFYLNLGNSGEESENATARESQISLNPPSPFAVRGETAVLPAGPSGCIRNGQNQDVSSATQEPITSPGHFQEESTLKNIKSSLTDSNQESRVHIQW